MDAGLGGEGTLAHIGRLLVGRAVQELVEGARDVGEALQALGIDAGLEALGEMRLQHQGGDDGDEVGIAAALADAVERALDVAHAGIDGCQRIGDRMLGVVMSVDAEVATRHVGRDVADDGAHFGRQRAAIGVAQHHPAGASLVSLLGAGQRIGGIGLEAVEEMFAVDQDFLAGGLRGLDRLADGLEVLLVGAAQRHAHVIVP